MASLKNRSFTNVADIQDGVLGDDFVHGCLETWKLKAKTSFGGKIDYKAKIKHTQKDGQLTGSLSDEVKFQFPYDKYTFWFGSRRNGDLKIHADFGNFTLGGQDYNLFSNLKTGINFKTFAFRFGANHFGKKITTSTRVECGCNSNACQGFGLTNRTFYRHGDFFYGLVTSLNLDTLQPTKYDAALGYEKDNVNVYLQHNSSSKAAGFALGTLVGQAFYKKDNSAFGISVSNDFQNKNQLSASLGAQHRCPEKKVTAKAKINNKLDLEVAWKKTINERLTVTASGKLALAKKAQAVDFSQYVPIPFGVQFDVSV